MRLSLKPRLSSLGLKVARASAMVTTLSSALWPLKSSFSRRRSPIRVFQAAPPSAWGSRMMPTPSRSVLSALPRFST
ncbi:hypothetical protein D3C81_2258750 [compost metagenome]